LVRNLEVRQVADAKKGLEGAVAAQTKVSQIDGKEGKLNYVGYEIQDLAEHSTFEEVVYLLHNFELPGSDALRDIQRTLAKERSLDDFIVGLIRSAANEMHPMSMLRTAVSAAQAHDPDGRDYSDEANLRKSYRLIAQTPQMVATDHRIRQGLEILPPREDLSLAGNFLYSLLGEEPDPGLAEDLDTIFILYADHTLNASTFAGRVAAATLADIHAAVTAAIATLQGPLHGGAIEEARLMLDEIGSPDRAEAYVHDKLAKKEKIMGFGHRVYKTWDPRAQVLRKIAERVTAEHGVGHLFEIAEKVQETVVSEKGLYPNVDFYTGSIYTAMGIPEDLFTCMFAIPRMAGWTALIREQYSDNRLIRPSSEYIGPAPRKWAPAEQR
jgi:citrate synthase